MASVPEIRITRLNEAPVRGEGAFVLYWMIAARRPGYNFGLQRAVELALELDRPLLVLEPLRAGYPWASDRLHTFLLEGMAHQKDAFAGTKVRYYPYVEPEPDAGKGLLGALAAEASVVVTDLYPTFFLPRMVRAAASRLAVGMEGVDSNGLLPLRFSDRTFPTAYAFRRELQKQLPRHLDHFPKPDPLRRAALRPRPSIPRKILDRWPEATAALLAGDVSGLPIDHTVSRVADRGGAGEATRRMTRFLDTRLSGYPERSNQPEADGTSRLSPYLHFGHLSTHEIFQRLARREDWSPDRLARTHAGKRAGWWGMSAGAEAFLDQLVTWRELGYNAATHRDDVMEYDSLPTWARATLADHAGDRRPHLYSLEEFENAQTHDPLWNAAQNQLRREGHIHNYLRMLWGKKILEWSGSPEESLQFMIQLNDKYALDGRDPNSYSGILWILGRYDRPWGPERPVFGKIRYMTSANTARKVSVKDYIRTYDGETGAFAASMSG